LLNGMPHKIVENSLFIDKFRLLVAVRLGDNRRGKSTVLNQLFNKDHLFSSASEPGANYGKPLTLDGSVELVWLTQETCKDVFWTTVVRKYYSSGNNEILLLANLHGDVLDHLETISYFNQWSPNCRYLIFRMPSCDDNHFETFVRHIDDRNTFEVMFVDPSPFDEQRHDMIETCDLVNDSTLLKVRTLFDRALLLAGSVVNNGEPHTAPRQSSSLTIIPAIETSNSSDLLKFISNTSCKETRQLLQNEVQLLVKANDDQRRAVLKVGAKNVRLLLKFVEILALPKAERQFALFHLERELFRMSNDESAAARSHLLEKRTQLQRQKVNLEGRNAVDIKKLQDEIDKWLTEVDSCNLGLEHFYRKLSQTYSPGSANENIQHIPKQVAELFVDGHSIELFNGDDNNVPLTWLLAISKEVDRLYPKLRVFVVSVIGLQSSGKSTLLNSLFACRFSVSVGRCSRGLFMKLLFLDKALQKVHKFDAILLIDTEGLGSPERFNNPEAEKRDRLLATLAIGISDLTIINVLGENMTELTEILQIAIVTLARLEQANVKPDILMVQHLMTEKNVAKIVLAQEELCKALGKAAELANEQDIQLGVRNSKRLETLYSRIRNGQLVVNFSPYKDGATVNSPPSENYHEEVVKLREKILEIGGSSNDIRKFADWSSMFESYWDCVSQENFALRFKNTVELMECIKRGQTIAQIKFSVDAAYRSHTQVLNESIITQTKDVSAAKEDMRAIIDLQVKENLVLVPHLCSCQKCAELVLKTSEFYDVIKGKPFEHECRETIQRYQKSVHDWTHKKLLQIFDAIIVKRGCSIEFERELNSRLHEILDKRSDMRFTDDEIKHNANEIYKKLEKLAEEKSNRVSVRETIEKELPQTYIHVQNFAAAFRKDYSCGEVVVQQQHESGQME
jgi:ribosome biogenesis GTPase A